MSGKEKKKQEKLPFFGIGKILPYLKHYRFEHPLTVKTDGRKGIGVLEKTHESEPLENLSSTRAL